MENRKRNTALVLIAAGLFLVVGNIFGFFTAIALVVLWLGGYLIRSEQQKKGILLIVIGALILISNHFMIVISIVLISLGLFYMKSKQVHGDGSYIKRQGILESIKWDKTPWVLRNSSFWCMIGEMNFDLSLAMAEEKETTLILQGIIGDIDIIVPEDMGVSVNASVLFGRIDSGLHKDNGFMNKVIWQSPNYDMCENKVRLSISYLIGDVDIKVLG